MSCMFGAREGRKVFHPRPRRKVMFFRLLPLSLELWWHAPIAKILWSTNTIATLARRLFAETVLLSRVVPKGVASISAQNA